MTTNDSVTQFRKDGKPRRKPRLGIPLTDLSRGVYVIPAAEKPNKERTLRRREERGQVVHLTHTHVVIDPAPSGPVRAGRLPRFPRHSTGTPEKCDVPREQKGSRTPGFVEVREGNVRDRMAGYRQATDAAMRNRRITRARRDARRAARAAAQS